MILRYLAPVLFASLAWLGLVGCSSSSSTLPSATGAYALTPEQAGRAMLEAITEGWPGKEAERLDDGRLGYRFKVWWAIDHDTVTIEALPQPGGRYGFRVENTGTAPASGNPARKKLLSLVQEHARRMAGD
jgi:hypothetical protein